jgi:acyl-CoA reductase-like NAD-dependent aldehyde dehydrogenase
MAGTLFDEWRAADCEAEKVEQALASAVSRALATGGEGPSQEQRRAARELRESADELFQMTMAEFAMRPRANTQRGSQ